MSEILCTHNRSNFLRFFRGQQVDRRRKTRHGHSGHGHGDARRRERRQRPRERTSGALPLRAVCGRGDRGAAVHWPERGRHDLCRPPPIRRAPNPPVPPSPRTTVSLSSRSPRPFVEPLLLPLRDASSFTEEILGEMVGLYPDALQVTRGPHGLMVGLSRQHDPKRVIAQFKKLCQENLQVRFRTTD